MADVGIQVPDEVTVEMNPAIAWSLDTFTALPQDVRDRIAEKVHSGDEQVIIEEDVLG